MRTSALATEVYELRMRARRKVTASRAAGHPQLFRCIQIHAQVGPPAGNMKLHIKIGGKTLTATLADNATARDFFSVLPLELSMKDLFGREKYATVPKALSEKGPRMTSYEVGDIAYWSP